jgi:hypothetical protein
MIKKLMSKYRSGWVMDNPTSISWNEAFAVCYATIMNLKLKDVLWDFSLKTIPINQKKIN